MPVIQNSRDVAVERQIKKKEIPVVTINLIGAQVKGGALPSKSLSL